MLVDGKGVPLGITVDATNRHHMKMTKTTLQSIVVNRPEPTTRAKQQMCMVNRFRRLLIRWEKKVENYEAILHFACTCITYRAAGLFAYVLR
jgi:putative transposase